MPLGINQPVLQESPAFRCGACASLLYIQSILTDICKVENPPVIQRDMMSTNISRRPILCDSNKICILAP
jgi:hypothetical protein